MSVNICIDNHTYDILKTLIGKTFDYYCCDRFVFSPCVYGIVGLSVENRTYKITALFETIRRFSTDTDVAVFRFNESEPTEIRTMIDSDEEMIKTPVESKIESISIVNDKQQISDDKNKFELDSTVGIIFKLSDSREIAFEIGTWFSEMITVRRGYELINSFTPVSEFAEEWEGTGYQSSVEREILVIS